MGQTPAITEPSGKGKQTLFAWPLSGPGATRRQGYAYVGTLDSEPTMRRSVTPLCCIVHQLCNLEAFAFGNGRLGWRHPIPPTA